MRLETDGHVIVLDPGAFTEPEAVDGATAVLITHEHADHYSADHLRRTDAPIHTIGDVAAEIREEAPDVAERITVVKPGENFDVGVPTTVVGEKHAVIHPEIPRIDNSGYLLEVEGTRIYHPGDSLTLPDGGRRPAAAAGQRALAEGQRVHRLRAATSAPRGRWPSTTRSTATRAQGSSRASSSGLLDEQARATSGSSPARTC